MGYADKRQLISLSINTADEAAAGQDNDDIHAIVVPAGREVEIQSMNAYVHDASDGADFIELVKEDNTVLCKIALQTTGAKAAVLSDGTTAATFPIRVAPQAATGLKILKLRLDGTTDTSSKVSVQVEITGL